MFVRILTFLRLECYSGIRLQYLIFLIFTLISAIPVLLLSYWVQETAYQKELSAVEDKHLVIARNLSRTFERYIIDTKSVFKHVGTLTINGTDWHESRNLLNAMGISNLCLVNINNHIAERENCSFSISTQQWSMLTTLANQYSNEVQVSNLAKIDDKPVFFLVQAITPGQLLIGTLETRFIIETQKSIAFGERGHSMVVDAIGQVIAHPKEAWVLSAKDASKLSVVQKMMRGETGVSTFFSPPMQSDMIAGHTSVPGVGWGVMVPQPLAELRAQAGDVRWAALFISIFGLIVAGFLGWIAARVLARPIESISHTATLIASGDSAARVSQMPKQTALEVIELADSFNQMVDRLEDSHTDLQRISERLDVTLASIGDGVITTDNSNNINYLNPVAEMITGWSMNEAVGYSLFEVLKIDDCHTGEPIEFLQEDENPILEGHLIRRDMSTIGVQKTVAKIYDSNREVIGLVIVIRDVTEYQQLTKRLSFEATHDSLTGLLNRSAFENKVTLAIEQSKQELCHHCLCYLDLDQFKVVNDTCGHAAGDELLRTISTVIKQCMPQNNILARLGGDEFGILLTQCSMTSALTIADTIREKIQQYRFIIEHQSFPIGVSIGVVEITDRFSNLGDIFKAADSACYIAKERGRNLVHAYRPTDEYVAERASEVRWVSRLHTALENDLFTLHFQPIIPLNNSDFSTTHYELLLRLKGPDKSLIYPDKFLPAAAHYNLLPAIDRWVFTKAICWINENRQLLDNGRISINLTGPTLSEDSFLEFTLQLFNIYGQCADAMIIEITESSALNNLPCAQQFMSSLSQMGCKFALDDFGKGFSSLSGLKHLAVDYIKIDGGFVSGMLKDSVDEAMVKTINEIGHSMNKIVVAEFVENEAIQSRLTELGIDFGQGYGIAKPCPLSEFAVFKAKSRRQQDQHKLSNV